MSSAPRVEGSKVEKTLECFYTGVEADGTTDIATAIQAGDLLYQVPYNARLSNKHPLQFTRHATALDVRPCVVVKSVPAANVQGGKFIGIAYSEECEIRVDGTTDVAIGDGIGGSNGLFSAVKNTTGAHSAKGIANEARTANSIGMVKCLFRGGVELLMGS